MKSPRVRKLIRRSIGSGLSLTEVQQKLEERLASMEEVMRRYETLLKRIAARMKMRPIAEAILVANMPYKTSALKSMRKSELYTLAAILGMSKDEAKHYGTRTNLAKHLRKLQEKRIESDD